MASADDGVRDRRRRPVRPGFRPRRRARLPGERVGTADRPAVGRLGRRVAPHAAGADQRPVLGTDPADRAGGPDGDRHPRVHPTARAASMTLRHGLAVALLFSGVLVVTASSIGALLAPDTQPRLHFVAPVASLGAPLIGAGLGVDSGLTLTTASIVLVVLLMSVTNPVLTSAVGRLAAQEHGDVPADEPQ